MKLLRCENDCDVIDKVKKTQESINYYRKLLGWSEKMNFRISAVIAQKNMW